MRSGGRIKLAQEDDQRNPKTLHDDDTAAGTTFKHNQTHTHIVVSTRTHSPAPEERPDGRRQRRRQEQPERIPPVRRHVPSFVDVDRHPIQSSTFMSIHGPGNVQQDPEVDEPPGLPREDLHRGQRAPRARRTGRVVARADGHDHGIDQPDEAKPDEEYRHGSRGVNFRFEVVAPYVVVQGHLPVAGDGDALVVG